MAGPITQIILTRAHGNKHGCCTPCGLIESFKKLNSRYKTSVPGAHPVAAHPSFLSMKWLKSIFPPNRMGSQLITTGGERHRGRKVFWPRTQYNDLARSWTQTSSLRVHCMNQSGHNIFHKNIVTWILSGSLKLLLQFAIYHCQTKKTCFRKGPLQFLPQQQFLLLWLLVVCTLVTGDSFSLQ